MLRTLMLAILAFAAFGATTGCQRNDAAQGRLFAVTYQTMNNPFFVELNEGLKEVIEAHGDRLVVLDAQFNEDRQKSDIAEMVQQNAATIFINPVNWQGIGSSLERAQASGVPCVVVDAPVKDSDLVLCTVASDNVEAGRLAARELAKVRPQAQIVILHHETNKACLDRVNGFMEELAKHPEMKVLAVQEGGGTTEAARPVMRDLLTAHPKLNAAFPINDPSALGVVSAVESTTPPADVLIVTVDGSKQGVDAIKAGKVLSSSAQFPRQIGRLAAQAAYDHLEGKPVEKEIKVPVELVTQENADAFLQKNR